MTAVRIEYLIIAAGALLCLLPSFRMPALVSRAVHWAAANQWRAILIAALLPVVARVALLPWMGVPVPAVHDEFGHLLTAETIASGRLANPVPPHWEHFESPHIFFQPVYASVYFPGNSIFLALSYFLTGHPWPGALAAMAVLCGIIVWSLEAWLPRRWALAGAILFGIRYGVLSYWVNSYWGGTVAGIGGFLLIGAFGPRRPFSPLAFGLAASIFLMTRPYEGAVAGAVISVAGALWKRRWVPALAIAALGVAMHGYFNYRLTGSALKSPYVLSMELYGDGAVLPFVKRPVPPPSPHDTLRRYIEQFEQENARRFDTWASALDRQKAKFEVWRNQALGPILLVPLLVGMVYRLRWGLALSAGLAVYSTHFILMVHYLSPLLGLHWMLLATGWRWLSLRPRTGNLAAALALGAVITVFAHHGMPHREHTWGCCQPPGLTARAALHGELTSAGGKHLVFVIYAPDHPFHDEWVYNGADIPAAPVIWARSMSPEKDAALMAAYADRAVWRVYPDRTPLAKERVR